MRINDIRTAAMAETYQVLVAPHNPQGPVSTAAAAHLAMSIPNFMILEYTRQDAHHERVLRGPWSVEGGHLEVPDLPGLGIELDEDGIAAGPARRLAIPSARAADGSIGDV